MNVNPLPLKPIDLEVGMVYYECSSGYNMKMTVVSPAEVTSVKIMGKDRNQYSWLVERKDGRQLTCVSTEGFEHYGPRIYREPQYCSYNRETKEFDFEVI